MHEADEPNALADFFDSEPLTGEHGRDVGFLPVHAVGGSSAQRNKEGLCRMKQTRAGQYPSQVDPRAGQRAFRIHGSAAVSPRRASNPRDGS